MQVHQTSGSGGIVYWKLGDMNREDLRARLLRIGFAHRIPRLKTETAALKTALDRYCKGMKDVGRDMKVEHHKQKSQHGFEVLDISRGEVANQYDVWLSAKLGTGRIEVLGQGASFAVQSELQSTFRRELETASSEALGGMLVAIATEECNGLSLRESGGVYWLPETNLERWQELAAELERVEHVNGATEMYLVKTCMDQSTIKAVRVGLQNEVVSEVSAIRDAILAGMGDEALENRKDRLLQIHRKVQSYEEILSESLTTLHAIITSVEEASAIAAISSLPDLT